jgi:uncharacterized protein
MSASYFRSTSATFMTAVLLAAIAVVAMIAAPQAGADERYGKQKVVYHINYNGGEDDKAYLMAMNNVQNHISAVGQENIDLKVVLHGDGVNLLKDAKTNDKVQQNVVALKSQNVAFQVCNNTLTGRKIDYKTDLFEVFPEEIVPSGVAELSRLQQMGYTYIKP